MIFLSFVCNYVSNISTVFYKEMKQKKVYYGKLEVNSNEINKILT